VKIIGIYTYILKIPLGEKRFYSSQCSFSERKSFLVKIETDEGIYGWGEGGQYGPAEPVKACVDFVLAPLIIGRDPLEKGRLWHELYSATRDFGQKGSYIEAMSAIDIALWDICGKFHQVPIGVLLGGRFRESVEAYATGCYYRGDDYLNPEKTIKSAAQEAVKYADYGFRMLKVKVGLLSVETDSKRIKAIRKQIGEGVGLFVDCNHAYNGYTAVRMGKQLEENNVLLMEEPVTPEDKEGYRHVRQHLSLAIASGECEYTSYGFLSLIRGGCVDIIQPDICVCGGISEYNRIVALAMVFGITVIPHVWGSGIALAVALGALSALPPFPHTANSISFQNEPIIEYDQNFNPLRDELLQENILFKDGTLYIPKGYGLGVDVREEILQKYLVE
jgi:D-galactarolactone cycloisomerase